MTLSSTTALIDAAPAARAWRTDEFCDLPAAFVPTAFRVKQATQAWERGAAWTALRMGSLRAAAASAAAA